MKLKILLYVLIVVASNEDWLSCYVQVLWIPGRLWRLTGGS
jgi:hypothetical protein